MRRWRKHRADEGAPAPSPAPPVELPDEREAEKALAEAKEGRKRVQTVLRKEVDDFLENMRAAREDNNFAEGIVEMIRHGR
jgi:hypothetical protein